MNLTLFNTASLFKAATSALENQVDQMVYQLYGLTEEEIRIIEGRN